ncbi:MAG: hypothetical protein CSA20_02065 [Deltaproteobacteria bacterium]|nr:MAG: hypothetical protein CSA20_02065 [Deltaproteobacteria bacterium]
MDNEINEASILVIDDDSYLLSAIGQTLKLSGYLPELQSDGEAALARLRQGLSCSAVITDIRMPHMDGLELLAAIRELDPELPVIMITGHGDVVMAVQAMRQGAYDFLEKPVDEDTLLNSLRRAVEKRRLVLENRVLQDRLSRRKESFFHGMVGSHPLMQQLYHYIERVAVESDPVLIHGATGTGKELVARALHQIGRPEQPFVALNMAAIPAEIVEAELFGYVKGTFTGAERKREGKLGFVGEGTLFLDEICSLDLPLQGKLLRVLEDLNYTPLGSNEERPFAARVVAASNRLLDEEIAAGRFREDLFYRLDVLSLHLPPLAERKEDIPLLVEFFCQEYGRERGESIPPFTLEMMADFLHYHWPGNIRELRNKVRRICVFGGDGLGDEKDIASQTLKGFVEEQERQFIISTLRQHGGRVGAVYEKLGLSRKGLYEKIKRYQIDLEQLRC